MKCETKLSGRPRAGARIVGGTIVNRNTWKWYVRLRNVQTKFNGLSTDIFVYRAVRRTLGGFSWNSIFEHFQESRVVQAHIFVVGP